MIREAAVCCCILLVAFGCVSTASAPTFTISPPAEQKIIIIPIVPKPPRKLPIFACSPSPPPTQEIHPSELDTLT